MKIEEAKAEGAKANASAAAANKQAVALEKDAAVARLEQERLKAQLAWRMLSVEAADRLVNHLEKTPSSANVKFVSGNPESQAFAIQIANLLKKAKWRVGMQGLSFSNTVIFGVFLPGSGADVEALRDAFSAVGIQFTPSAINADSMGFGSPIDGVVTEIIVGSKAPPR